ncbi:hypothetical protein EXIGLDRAFT_707402 [Exidia glandulosa HHB12029]|uniref:Uncharacterized protein n=1 Tax=Exidia glandulosa HHB12029 TaxID=1314781 RepID=A0A166NK03_EXIGL|nr:hypothetical protein EXIGLDRAFT_707402 [Exidia glandulosa HHB12029]
MAKHGEATTRGENVVEYVADDKLAQSGSARYTEWKREVVEPLKRALMDSEPELGDWLATTCEKAVQGCLDPPTAPGGPCVVNGEVVCSPYAIPTFISSGKVSRSFASEFDLPADDEPEIPPNEASERTERYFSARVLAEVFLSYRIVLAQLVDAGSKEKRALRDSWFQASVRAACDLVRPAHFAILSNLSFAVVCCVVDSGYEMQSVWPASLMTQDRIRAARKRVDFDAWARMSCLPLIRACNLCAASQGKKQGRPRICTFIPADDKSIVSCLACTVSGQKSACKIVYVKDSTDGAEQDYGEDENSDDDMDDDAETSTTTLTQPTGSLPMRTSATLALNASSTSGATVKVPLVDYESLVRFHEAMSHLKRITGAAGAAVRGRTTIDAVRQSRKEEDEVMRSIALARKELSRLEDQITLSRGEVLLYERPLVATARLHPTQG